MKRSITGDVVRSSMAITLTVLLSARAMAQNPAPSSAHTEDETAIRRVIADHYVNAVFVARDEAAVRTGFHPDFHLFVLDTDSVIVAPLDMWLGRLKLDGKPSTDVVRHEVALLDVAGEAAMVRTELFENDRHIYTDYFSLYRFPDKGWRIITKIFQDRD